MGGWQCSSWVNCTPSGNFYSQRAAGDWTLYDRAVDQVLAVDASDELLRFACPRVVDAIVPVSLVRASAETLPFAGGGLRYGRDDLDPVLDCEPESRAE